MKTATINQSPVWTPDAEHIIFTSQASGKMDLWSVAVRNGRASGSPSLVRRNIGDLYSIGMTRSGGYYYAQRKQGVEQVSIAELKPGGRSRIVETFVGMNPSWSADGKSIAFSRHTQADDTFDLIVRSVATAEETVYRHPGLRPAPPRWLRTQPRLLQVVYMHGDQSRPSWYLLDPKTGELSEALGKSSLRAGTVALSANDASLFIPTRHTEEADNIWNRIIEVDLRTNEQRTIFTLPGSAETFPRPGGITLALNPAGDHLAIGLRNPKTREAHISLVRTDGTDYRDLDFSFKAPNVADKLVWSKDGRSLLFAENGSGGNDWRIMRVGLNGGAPEFTGVAVKYLSTFDLSPDGSHIAFSTLPNGSTTSDLMIIDNLTALLKDSR